MGNRVCPWWLGYFLASPLRRWIEIRDPEAFLRPYVKPGMTVFEPGPGMGFFTLPMANLVGPSGHIVAADPGADAQCAAPESGEGRYLQPN